VGNVQNYLEWALELVRLWSPKLLTALILLVAGMWIIRLTTRATARLMTRREVDASLRGFLRSLISISLKVLLLISVAGMLGIETTSFIALIGAAGLAIGLALQGSLANFAGGVLILINKPFRAGDYIEAQGVAGSVHEILIFNTILKTPDNKTIFLPNGPLAGGNIVNFSAEAKRRVDMTFGISYSDDIQKAREVIRALIGKDQRIIKDPAPMVVISGLADSSVNFAVRVWCKREDYWDIFFDMHEQIKQEFDNNNISIPFPQRDVHVHQVAAA